jgi:hypothetical protein
MHLQKLTLSLTALAGWAAVCLTPPASAASLRGNWSYAIDSFNDGYGGGTIGSRSAYEMSGIAISQQNGKFYVALNGNMPITGVASDDALDGNIGWGDLLLNFTGNPLASASSSGSLLGVRFAPTNNSGAPSLGVYQGVTAQSVTATNNGFASYIAYNSAVQGVGGTSTMADLSATAPYLTPSGSILNSIGSGTKVGDIEALSAADLVDLGLNFAAFNATGSQTIGFSFDQSLLPAGDFIATLLAECGNDGMAIQAAAVPEPTSMAGLALAGSGLALLRRRLRSTKPQS